MSRLGLLRRTVRKVLPRTSDLPLSPRVLGELSRRQDQQSNRNLPKGGGSIDPTTVNNRAMLILFGFLAAGLVLTSIWFFFWAKNGGFYFKKGDWEDYKSTVLRRKGKDGKTLSNATKSTELGSNSVSAEYDHDDVVHAHHHHDEDVRQYRHEKPARVGGLNRKPDGSYYDHTNSTRSETTIEPINTGHKKGFFEREKKERVKNAPRVPSTAYSFVAGDDSTIDGSSYVDESRSHHRSHRQHQSSRYEHHRRTSRSPRKSYRDQETYSEPTSYGDGSTENGDSGTKSYPHYIPGLSKGTRRETNVTEESRSDRKARSGYRRGGGRRRDSLSGSEEGEVTSRWTVGS